MCQKLEAKTLYYTPPTVLHYYSQRRQGEYKAMFIFFHDNQATHQIPTKLSPYRLPLLLVPKLERCYGCAYVRPGAARELATTMHQDVAAG
ncbi:unnamed protein product [Brassica rapa subsp. trilocularis]